MKLTVVMVNTWRTHIATVHENSYMPYMRRTVQIELTPEQVAALAPQKIGLNCGKDVHEEMGEIWLEASTPNDGTQRPGTPDGSLATETRKPGSLK